MVENGVEVRFDHTSDNTTHGTTFWIIVRSREFHI